METKVIAIITNQEGWQRRLPLAEGILWLGSAPEAQIHLVDEDRIVPYHLQIVNSLHEDSLRVINISGKELIWQDELRQAYRLAPGGFKDVYGSETLLVGPYTLQFEIDKRYVQRQVVCEGQDHAIGLRLVLSGQVLRPGSALNGTLYLQNRGSEPCQFNVELTGLPAECFEIEPPPLINAGGEETAEIHFYHLGTSPLAGLHNIVLEVSAPQVYPGRVISMQQTLKVAPSYQHVLSFEDAPPAISSEPVERPVVAREEQTPQPVAVYSAPAAPAVESAVPLVEKPVPPSNWTPSEPAATPAASGAALEPQGQLDSTPVVEPVGELVAPIPEETAPLAPRVRPTRVTRPDLSAVKVIKASSGDFLEKEEPRR